MCEGCLAYGRCSDTIDIPNLSCAPPDVMQFHETMVEKRGYQRVAGELSVGFLPIGYDDVDLLFCDAARLWLR